MEENERDAICIFSELLTLAIYGSECHSYENYDPVCMAIDDAGGWRNFKRGIDSTCVEVAGMYKTDFIRRYCTWVDVRREIETQNSANQALSSILDYGEIAGKDNKSAFKALLDVSEKLDFLKYMKYRDFLNSKYWKIVRGYVKNDRGGKCQLCSSRDRLNVHHNTYEHHGAEHLNLNDLVLLCGDCHSKFHDLKTG